MTGPEMVAHAKALGPVIVCEDNGHTYPATLTYWHLTGRHKGPEVTRYLGAAAPSPVLEDQ